MCIRDSYRPIRKASFKEFVDVWLKDYAEPRVITNMLKKSTFLRYEGIINKYLVPSFGGYDIASITPARVQKFMSTLIKDKNLSASSVRMVLITLGLIFKQAISQGYCKQNPVSEIEKPHSQKHEQTFLTPDELRRLFNAADEPYKTIFIFAAMTGCRRGEILALKWDDIDFERKLVYIRRTVFNGEFTKPKSRNSTRVLAIADILANKLLEHKIASPKNDLDLVFPNSEGGIMSGGHLSKWAFKHAVKKAKIDRHVRFHDLRHSFASLLIYKGEHIRVIQSVMGHANISTTMDIYGHIMQDAHSEASNKVSDAIFND
jgi:integrase